MDQDLLKNIERYKEIDWNSLTREDSFAEGKNFSYQKKLFDQIKRSFDLVFDNINILSELLPIGEMNQINILINRLFNLKNEIAGYSDTNRHQEVADNIKRVSFEIQDKLSKYLEYINPSNVKEKMNKELDDLVRVKNEVEKAVKERLEILDQGIQKTSEGKREISGIEAASFFEDQAARHRDNAEGNGRKIFWGLSWSRGWLGTRNIIYWFIIGLIITTTVLYIATFFEMGDVEKWKLIWNVRMSVLFVALLTILYTGLYFAAKNYDREKDLEYKNKIRANIAKTWLTFSAGQSESVRDIVAKEAAKTLFSDIAMSEKGKKSENRNISISIPQNIGKSLNDE